VLVDKIFTDIFESNGNNSNNTQRTGVSIKVGEISKEKINEAIHVDKVASITPAIANLRRITINWNHNKIIHLLVEVNNSILKGLIDIGVSMFIIVTNVIRELGIMHLVTSSKSYKIALGVVMQSMGKISELLIRVEEMLCKMDFMVVDTYGYDVLLSLDFLIKTRVIVNIE
jgi:hypothetical protein